MKTQIDYSDENKLTLTSNKLLIILIIVCAFFLFLIFDWSNLTRKIATDNVTPTLAVTLAVSETPELTPTILPSQFLDSGNKLDYQKMLTASSADALSIIEYAFIQIGNIKSIGYKFISSDGQGYDSMDNYKFEVDKNIVGVNYSFESSNQYSSGIQEQRHSNENGTIANQGDTAELLKTELPYIVFQSSTTDSSGNQVNDSTFLKQNDLSSWEYKVGNVNLNNGIQAVKFSFVGTASSSATVPQYQITIGVDGKIYYLLLPNLNLYSEYSNFEYNKSYELKSIERYVLDSASFKTN